MHALSSAVDKGSAGLLQLSGYWFDCSVYRLAVWSMQEPQDGSAVIWEFNWQQLAPAYRSLHL